MTLALARRRGPLKILHAYFDYPETLGKCDIVRLNQVPKPPSGPGWKCVEFFTLHVDLGQSRDELLRQTHANTRYKIRRASTKDGLTTNVTHLPTPSILDRFVAFHNQFTPFQKLSSDNQEYLMKLAHLGSLGISWVSSEVSGDLAFHAFILGSNRARLLLSVIQSSHRSCEGPLLGRANRLLHWEDICYFKDCGLSCYDFGGLYTKDDDSKLLEIAKFKSGFGGRVVKEYKCTKALTFKGSVALGLKHAMESFGTVTRRIRNQVNGYRPSS